MRMHKNILGGGHLLGNNSRVARRHRCAGVGRPQISASVPRVVAAGTSLALVLLAGALLFPTTPDVAHAEEPATATPRAIEDPTVSLSVPATIEFADVMATPSGATTTASAEIEVATTASAGYKLYVYAEDNSLKSLNPQTQQTIAATTQTSAVEKLANNTWGYNLSEGTTAGTTFAKLPTSDAAPAAEKDTSATGGATGDIYTLALGAKVDSTMPSGTYTATMTVAAVAEPSGIPITYDANGGYYNGDSSQTTQQVSYNVSAGKIAKTSNISDDGVQSGGYGDNVGETQTVTIPGAESLQVTVSYQTESTSYDWLAIYDGSVTPSQSNYDDSVTGKLGGRTKVDNEVFIIPGDTAQFYFRSDGSGSNYYGYYAVVQEVPTLTPSAEVLTPARPGYVFWGWYKDAAGTKGEEFTVDDSLQAGTVYAKWLLDVGPIQNYTSTQCAAQASTTEVAATDSRGGVDNVYTLRYITGSDGTGLCWMTQNLRIAKGTQLTSADSNLPEGTTYTIPTADLTLGNSYTEGRVHAGEPSNGESATDTGYWYNFCAASAGQVCSDTVKKDATQDICPKGWRLPLYEEAINIAGKTYLSAFAPVTGGRYTSGADRLTSPTEGFWWGSGGVNNTLQNYFYFNGTNLTYGLLPEGRKSYGFYVRCVAANL